VILLDVNVLVYAHREDAERHVEYRDWLLGQLSGPSSFAYSDHVLSGFVRIVTHPRIFTVPSPLKSAFEFADVIRAHPGAVSVQPGYSHWKIFARLCREAGAKGNLAADAYFAALAIENGCEWITTDRDYARFKDLKWRHPLGSD
jgi:hypothetical protein